VTVKFAQQETERRKRARERSFGYLSKKSAEEPWFHTRFHSSCSEKAEVCSQIVAQRSLKSVTCPVLTPYVIMGL